MESICVRCVELARKSTPSSSHICERCKELAPIFGTSDDAEDRTEAGERGFMATEDGLSGPRVSNMAEDQSVAINVDGVDIDETITLAIRKLVPDTELGLHIPVSAKIETKTFKIGFWTRLTICILLGLVEFLCGSALSILAPFYTSEASDHGLTITQSSIVFSSVFILQIFLTPLFGKFLGRLGAINLLMFGSALAGLANVAFGGLAYIQSSELFFLLSLVMRGLIAVGESAINTSVYPIARSMASDEYSSTALSFIETLYGLGTTFGPFIGGCLYKFGGFYLPFMICGILLVLTGVTSVLIMQIKLKGSNEEEENEIEGPIKFRNVLQNPMVILCCLVVILTGMSTQWYQPTMEPYLSAQFGLQAFTVSLFFVIDGGVYACLSPVWGLLLDKGLSGMLCMAIGCGTIALSFLVMGPVLLPIQSSPTQVAVAMAINGIGMAANFIGSLIILGHEVGKQKSGQLSNADNEQVHGMATSLWITCECIGSFLGSLAGGYTFERYGWSQSNLLVSLLLLGGLMIIIFASIYNLYNGKMKDARLSEPEILRKLLGQELAPDYNTRSDLGGISN